MDNIIRHSLSHRLLVLMATVFVAALGLFLVPKLAVDIFPDLTAPTVTILTETPGLASEETELQVTFPIETAMNGAPNVRRVRSSSSLGLSVVWVEFAWGTDIFLARQLVNEKLQTVQENLPQNIHQPTMAPISSIMGEIILIGLCYKDVSPDKQQQMERMLELRSIADWNIRRRLLSVSGVSQVVPIGGGVKEFQVLIEPAQLRSYGISLEEVETALQKSNHNFSGGIYFESGQEHVVRGIGRITSKDDIENSLITLKQKVPVLLKHIAEVRFGPAIKRGDGSLNGQEAVILSVQKQPHANTLELTKRLDEILDQVQLAYPDIQVNKHIFRQADFITVAINNVKRALVEGAILVFLVLLPFTGSLRVTAITTLVIPLSLLVATLAMYFFNFSINTMTLGGMAIAIGMLVDDAIIFIDNIARRLRQNAKRLDGTQANTDSVIFHASKEVMNSVLFATLIIIVVFLPLFFLSGVEGRMFQPLGFSFIFSLSASLLVAVTLIPALGSYLLSHAKFLKQESDTICVRFFKRCYHPVLDFSLRCPRFIIGTSILSMLSAIFLFTLLGRSFLPGFNEGSLTIIVETLPGTSLEQSNVLGAMAEKILLRREEVLSTARRTGRSELDEHAEGVHFSEIDVRIQLEGKNRERVLAEIRRDLSALPGALVSVGQPISHRIDHILSGTEAAIAVKLYGDDLDKMRQKAKNIEEQMKQVEGVVDLFVEQQINIPETKIIVLRNEVARHGLQVDDVARQVQIALAGRHVSRVIEGEKSHDIVLKLHDNARGNFAAIGNCLIDTYAGKIPLFHIATIIKTAGPNIINREDVKRKIVIQANVSGRDLGNVISDVKKKIAPLNIEQDKGYYVVYGGQFESQENAARLMLFLSLLSLVCIFFFLYMAFANVRAAMLVIANLPLALMGGVIAIFFTDGILSVASMIGFITLFGIATRNGIMLVCHYNYLLTNERKTLRDAVYQGSMERLSPIMMTAITAGLGLLPLVLEGSKAGNEIQSPMALVILGGLWTSTLLNVIVIPSLFLKFGLGAEKKHTKGQP